jgi:DNA-binding GntR family transcriptional regulator
VADCIEADVSFHRCLSRLAASDVITETINPLWPHFRRLMGRVLMQGTHRKTSWQGHRHISEAILAGDAPEARRLMKDHIQEAKMFILDKIQPN